MRIAMFSWETLHSIAVGGVAVHVSELARALAARGHDVHVFTRMGEGQPEHSRADGVDYHRCPFDLDPYFVAETENMCRSFAWHMGQVAARDGHFDIAHGHDWLTAKAIVQIRNDLGYPCAFTFHSTEFGRCNSYLYDGPCRTVRDMEWEAAYCSDRVITVSDFLRREVMGLFSLNEDKVRVIHNGVSVERFERAGDAAALRAMLAIGPSDPVALFCGRLTWHKGPDLLIEAAPAVLARHPGAKFIFAGDGDMRWGLEGRAHELGVMHAIRFIGQRDGGEVATLFRLADVVCVPSRHESFAIVGLEAWSAATPLVITQRGGPVEYVTHEENGLLIYDSPDSVAWGLLRILDDPERAARMASNGRTEAEHRFTWDGVAVLTEQVYLESIHARRDSAIPVG